MITLLTAEMKFFHPLHPYQYTDEYKIDSLVIGGINNKLIYIAINRDTESIIVRQTINYKSATNRLFNAYFPGLYHTDLTLEHAFGFYRIDNSNILTTIFMVQYHSGTKKYFLSQCNILNHNVTSLELIAVRRYLNTAEELSDVMIRKSSVYSDNKIISDYDVYIMHTTTDEKGKRCVDGIRVLTIDDEKSEFESMYNLSLVKTQFPVVDQWSTRNFRFYDMPEDVEQHTFNFSTGMGMLRFS